MEDGIEFKDSALIGIELDKIWACDCDTMTESLIMDGVETRDDTGFSVSTDDTLAEEVNVSRETKAGVGLKLDSDDETTVEEGKSDSDGILSLVGAVNSACEVESKIGDIDESLETVGYKDGVSVGYSIMLSEVLECEVSSECSVEMKLLEEDDELNDEDDHVE